MAEDQQKTETPENEQENVEQVATDVQQEEGAVASTEPVTALAEPVATPTPSEAGGDGAAADEESESTQEEAEEQSLIARAVDAVEHALGLDDDEENSPTDEAPVAENKEDEDDRSFIERAVDAVQSAAGSVAETVAAMREAISSEEDRPTSSVASVEDLRARKTSVGYRGEIIGDVVKLEDIDRESSSEVERTHADLRRMVEATMRDIPEHDIVQGRIVTIGDKDVVIDIGFKSDGVVAKNEFDRELVAGDLVEVYIERRENYQGQLILSKTKANTVQRWRRVENAFENEEILEGTIVRRIKGGMIVELFDDMEAFLPGSQIDVRPVRDFDAYLERRMEFKIVKLNPANENIVVSHKALIERDLQEQRESILETMEAGQILEGVVKNITDFGVFVDLGGVDGLLHITDLSWGRVAHPSEVLSIEDKVNVVVLDYDKDRQRISLGLKQLQPHPWDEIHDTFAQGQVVEGKVVSITDYGAFVELEKGIEGLVHISEMSWTEHVKHPSQVVALGQVVEVKILNIDDDSKKISLGMKQLQPDPWEGIAARYPLSTVLRGKVRNITAFGVFVEIEQGIDGLVHISDLSWTKKVRHPGEVVKKGQELDVVVLGIDEKNRRISLGHKQVETNPWNTFANVYTEGSDHEATVSRVLEAGVVVDLPLDVEGFIPAGELKKTGHPADYYREGQTLEGLRVIRFDLAGKEIILSENAAERDTERSARENERAQERDDRTRQRREVRDYVESANTGPATLGELSGLAQLKAQMEAAEQQAESAEEEAPNPDVDTANVDEVADEATGAKPLTGVEGGQKVTETEALTKPTGGERMVTTGDVVEEALDDDEDDDDTDDEDDDLV